MKRIICVQIDRKNIYVYVYRNINRQKGRGKSNNN